MFKRIIAALALAGATVTPAMAELTRLGTDLYSATDNQNSTHYIEYVRKDHEGDVQIKVTVGSSVAYYWVNCRNDSISQGGDAFDGWHYVDHRKMEGYYSDVACRM